MLNKFLREVVGIIVGKPSEEIAEILYNKNYINEFLIAKKLGITINQARNILYKISDCGLVSFIRKKDKKKGWYTYFWKIESLKSLQFLKEILIKKMAQMQYQIVSREKKQFYICKRCDKEFNEENALLCNFTCNECGDIFNLKDNSKMLRELKRNFGKLKNKVDLIDEEIEKEKEKIEKKRVLELKEEEKLKKKITKKSKRVSKETPTKKKATNKKKLKFTSKKVAEKKIPKKSVIQVRKIFKIRSLRKKKKNKSLKPKK